MQLIRGIAKEVDAKRHDPAVNHAALELRVDGHAVRIDLSGYDADAAPIPDGDEVIIAGKAKKGLISVLAYKNLTQDQETHTPSSAQDAFFTWFAFCFGAVMLRFSWSGPATGQNLFPLPQWFTVGLGGIVLFFAAISLWLVADKYAARRLVDRAALETLVGEARIVEPEGPDRYPKVEVQGLAFFLETSRRLRIEEGDKLAVTVDKTGGDIIPLAFANLTRSTHGKSRAARGDAAAMAFGLAFAGFVAFFASEWLFNDAGNIMIFLVGAGLLVGIATILMSNFYRWKLTREALRMTKIAAQQHG